MGFLVLVVLNLVAAMQAMGTLLSIGLIVLPAAASRLWVRSVGQMMALSTFIGLVCSALGLLASYHFDLPAGPSVVLGAGAVYFLSLLIGREGGIVGRLSPAPHLEH
jgi:zinc/manganese transport system permease protein